MLKLKKRKFNFSNYPINRNNVVIDKIIIFIQFFFGKKSFKYFIGHKDDEKIEPLCKLLLKMSGYTKVLMKLNTCLFS